MPGSITPVDAASGATVGTEVAPFDGGRYSSPRFRYSDTRRRYSQPSYGRSKLLRDEIPVADASGVHVDSPSVSKVDGSAASMIGVSADGYSIS